MVKVYIFSSVICFWYLASLLKNQIGPTLQAFPTPPWRQDFVQCHECHSQAPRQDVIGVMGPGLVGQLWVRNIIASASVGQLLKVSSFADVASMHQFYATWGKIDSHYILIQFNSAARSKSPTVDGKDMAVNSRMVSWKMEGFPRWSSLFFTALLMGY